MIEEFDINEWHKSQKNLYEKHYDKFGTTFKLHKVRHVVCADGFVMSVQASELHYCKPRKTFAWPYSAFEVGFPSQREEALMPFCWDDTKPTDTVYGCVPAETINMIVAKHGGITPSNELMDCNRKIDFQ